MIFFLPIDNNFPWFSVPFQIEKVKAATIAAGNWPAAGSSSTDTKSPPPPFPAHVDDEDEDGLC